MNLWESPTYLQDLKTAVSTLENECFDGKSFLITGASGLIGSPVVDLLLYGNMYKGMNMTIYAAGRNIEKLRKRFPEGEKNGVVFVRYDATQAADFDFSVDYIIHGASNASPDKYVQEPVDTMLANILGVNNLLAYARKIRAKKMVYISSSEVYGKLLCETPIKENQYGITDVLALRSAYPLGKQAAETLCVGYSVQYGINVSMVRPGHIYGPTAQATDNRVSSAFARQAADGENIVMKSTGAQIRSYCYCMDCATAILTVLAKGKAAEAYNISNPNSIITIRQMAELIARYAEVSLGFDVPSSAEKAAFNPMDNASLNSEKLEALGWKGLFDAETGFEHTILILRETS